MTNLLSKTDCTAKHVARASLYHEGKNRAMPRFLRPYDIASENLYFSQRHSGRSAPFTNTYRRAVSEHASDNQRGQTLLNYYP